MPLEFKIRYLFVRCTFITKLTDGVAVITAITQANDIKAATQALTEESNALNL